MSRSIIIMPDEGAKPLLDALASAKRSLRVKMFLFDDPALLAAVIDAQQRGVKVRVHPQPGPARRRAGERGDAQAAREGGRSKWSTPIPSSR